MTSITDIASTQADIQIGAASVESLSQMLKRDSFHLSWNCLFTRPEWMDAWLSFCRGNDKVKITLIRQEEKLLGVAPLMVNESKAELIGSHDLCDYLDFTVDQEKPLEFYKVLLSHLAERGIRSIELGPLREDSTTLSILPGVAGQLDWRIESEDDEVSYEMNLPETWEAYLSKLKSKQRHEIRRKLRRLSENADFYLRSVETPEQLAKDFDKFLDLFRQSRADKNDFMTDNRLAFFRRLTTNMADAGMLRLYFLDIESEPVACALCFENDGTLYLYNSGYNRNFASWSVGQVCTFLTIRDGIEKGIKCYNFLKGDEVYKKRLGGRPVQLTNLKLTR